MNAIILAAGKSSRMYATGASVHKALLPIMGIPNIERTILMLHDHNIKDIIIAVPAFNHDFDYLFNKYSCKVINIPPEGKNTLYAINYLLEYINNTFIIEGDVVCAQNIFRPLKTSSYYVMKYELTEQDAWHPILNEKGEIESFEIIEKESPALFGISFWNNSTSKILKEHIISISTSENLNNPNIFWDDFIQNILSKIKIKTIEILQKEAYEMNTYEEYILAQTICKNYLHNCQDYFEKMYIEQTLNNQHFRIYYVLNKTSALEWQKKLLRYYNKDSSNKLNDNIFANNEFPFIIKNNQGNEYGYFSIVEERDFIFLRRLFIDENYRYNGFGSTVIKFSLTYARLKSKELRVNVYDAKAESFYHKIGFSKNYTCYHIK